MKNLTTAEMKEMQVKELREIAKEQNIPGRWDMKKDQLISAIERIQLIDRAIRLQIKIKYTETVEELAQLIVAKEQELAAVEAMKSEQKEGEEMKEEKPQAKKKHGRTRTIEVYKDEELVTKIVGLLETFKWAEENKICNQGWVKHSLRNGVPTVAGRKFKEEGYLFKYAE
ncbi:Rho termination factor N-terminal domain-containing protein [Priestia megaterium]|uniref:Rho termination factor N-terminal domain-containing protein n=1 Tax=Priestia megaterium TaxID=1404 RepID=UPI000BEBD97D|nr:Rho termination factor N-terminal domain-containing protein [Priestia megaterium]PED63951.1 hypothetical protein CON20_23575 [Priestia megaterium]